MNYTLIKVPAHLSAASAAIAPLSKGKAAQQRDMAQATPIKMQP